MAQVCHWNNLLAAWRKVRRNKGQAGSDGLSITAFEANLTNRLRDIQHKLRRDTYQPQPLKAVLIPKPSNGHRVIRIPAVSDRVVQQAILNVLGPGFDPKFSDASYGFRPGRSAHQAVSAVQGGLSQGLVWVVEADLVDFFDTLDWTILLGELGKEVHDSRLLRLLGRFLKAGVLKGQRLTAVTRGTHQGAVFSPLMANAYLHPFDVAMTAKGFRLVRYGDDFVSLHRTRTQATEAFRYMQALLEEQLKLRLHTNKTRIVQGHTPGFEFLSFRFAKGTVTPAPDAVARFRAEVQRLLHAGRHQEPEALAARLNPLVRGWGEYFRIGHVEPLYAALDAWVDQQLASLPTASQHHARLQDILAKYRS
jgi:group II intron reverse transcriptase/maturase